MKLCLDETYCIILAKKRQVVGNTVLQGPCTSQAEYSLSNTVLQGPCTSQAEYSLSNTILQGT
jgi:hypothetical protein